MAHLGQLGVGQLVTPSTIASWPWLCRDQMKRLRFCVLQAHGLFAAQHADCIYYIYTVMYVCDAYQHDGFRWSPSQL